MKVLVVCLLCLSSVALAQEATKAPALDEVSQLVIREVVAKAEAEALALAAVRASDAYKQYEAIAKARQQLQANADKKIAAKYPGFAVEWKSRTLVPKAPAKPGS